MQVVYRHGAPYAFRFTLDNDSVLPVEVVRFPSKTWGGLLQPVSISVDGGAPQPLDRPFTIPPHGSAHLQLQARFGNCMGFGPYTGATLLSVPVRYRALWFTHTEFVNLPACIHVDAPDSCPGTAWE